MNAPTLGMGGHARVGLEVSLFLDPASKELGSKLALLERLVASADAPAPLGLA